MSINRRAMQLATIGAAIALVATLTLVVTNLSGDDTSGADLLSGAEPLPEGSNLRGRPGAEQSAIELADFLGAITLENGDPCPKDRLAVSWDAPTEEYETGAHYTPVGPEPGPNTISVNGIVTCTGSTHSYSGFAARWDGEQWETDLTPAFFHDDVDGEFEGNTSGSNGSAHNDRAVTADDLADDDLTADEFAALLDEYATDGDGGRTDTSNGSDTGSDDPSGSDDPGTADESDESSDADDTVDAETRSGLVDEITALEVDENWEGLWEDDPEDLADYEPQQICSPDAKPGTEGFKDLVLAAYPETGDFGISRDCGFSPDGTSTSEHYEGRAWDWKVLVDDAQDRKAASEIIGWLLASDENGNEYAMARRLGVMYVIYNNSMWRSYRADDGWLGYNGANPHTDHVHISFDRAGGLGDTSFWEAEGLPELAAAGFGPVGYLPDAGGISTGGPGGGFFGTTRTPDSSRADGGGANRIPVVPAPGSDDNGGGNGGNGVGDDVGNPPSTPGVPQLPSVPVPQIPVPTVPQLPNPGGVLPTCPPGTPVLPLPLDCLLPNRGGGLL